MLGVVLGLIGPLTSIVGWFGFHSLVCVIIGTALCIILTLLQWKDLNRNARRMDLVSFLVGSVVGILAKKAPAWYICGMLGISFYGLFVNLLAVVFLAAPLVRILFAAISEKQK